MTNTRLTIGYFIDMMMNDEIAGIRGDMIDRVQILKQKIDIFEKIINFLGRELKK